MHPSALVTDSASRFPAIVLPGQKLDIKLQVFNVGEGVANDVKVAVYSTDPRGLTNAASDNMTAFSLARGESNRLPPLFGTEIPDVLHAASLLHVVSVPNARGLSDMLSLPGLDALLGKSALGPIDVGSVNGALQRKLGIGMQDLNRVIK